MWKELAGIFVTTVGLMAAVFSFFPHITISDPVQMDATDLFSYQITVTNGGVLPIFGMKWALAPRIIKISNDNSHMSIQVLAPHNADWIVSSDVMASVIKPSTERHAAFMFFPGSELTVPEPADYEFHLRPVDNSIGTLTPGDQFTFTTEGLMSAPPGSTYDAADFAIAIIYIPVFPMIPMQTCSHFHVYKDRQGNLHWFRAANQCDRFPWVHNWF